MPLRKKKRFRIRQEIERPKIDTALARWTEKYCPNGCGAKMRTDGTYLWCSLVGGCKLITKVEKC